MRYLGSSNFAGWQVADAEWTARTRGYQRFISAQNRVQLARARRRGATWCQRCERYGVGLLPYYPLASGLLTGKYRRGEPPPAGQPDPGAGVSDLR